MAQLKIKHIIKLHNIAIQFELKFFEIAVDSVTKRRTKLKLRRIWHIT